jgi:hypothetical protein
MFLFSPRHRLGREQLQFLVALPKGFVYPINTLLHTQNRYSHNKTSNSGAEIDNQFFYRHMATKPM